MIGETDFAWPEFGAVGEADGDQKYLDAEFRGGDTAEQVFLDEKHREDRLRALPRTVRAGRGKPRCLGPASLGKTASLGLPVGVLEVG